MKKYWYLETYRWIRNIGNKNTFLEKNSRFWRKWNQSKWSQNIWSVPGPLLTEKLQRPFRVFQSTERYVNTKEFLKHCFVHQIKDLWLQMDGIAMKCGFCQRAYCRLPLLGISKEDFLEVQNNQYIHIFKSETPLHTRHLVSYSTYSKFSFLFISKRLAKRLITDVKRRRQLSRQVAPAPATADALTPPNATHWRRRQFVSLEKRNEQRRCRLLPA